MRLGITLGGGCRLRKPDQLDDGVVASERRDEVDARHARAQGGHQLFGHAQPLLPPVPGGAQAGAGGAVWGRGGEGCRAPPTEKAVGAPIEFPATSRPRLNSLMSLTRPEGFTSEIAVALGESPLCGGSPGR